MNATTFAALRIDQQRAARLDRENELLRSHAERPAAQMRPTAFAVVTDLFARGIRVLFATRTPRIATAG